MAVIVSFVTLVVMVAALIDVIVRDEGQVKHLPKIAWIIVVILLPLIGGLLWFGIGREWRRPSADLGSLGDPRRRQRPAVPASAEGPSQTELELARLDEEIARAEREERIRRLERELDERRRAEDGES